MTDDMEVILNKIVQFKYFIEIFFIVKRKPENKNWRKNYYEQRR